MRILFVYNTKASFTYQDLEILREKHQVDEAFISSPQDSFWYSSPLLIRKYDLIYLWFSSLNFFPIFLTAKLLGKKVFIVAGGFDVASLPELKYGGGCDHFILRVLRKRMLNQADYVLSVSYSNQKDLIKTIGSSKRANSVVSYGFKDPSIQLKPFHERPKKIITIGAINKVTFERKGLRFFAELSRLMPDWSFVMVGKADEEFKGKLTAIGGPNLKITGYLPDNDFHQEITTSRFYLQLSHHEAFGLSVVDAGLLGVYPIVFDRYSLPEVIEGVGTVVPFQDLESVKKQILKLDGEGYDGAEIKNKLLTRFDWNKKRNNLLKIISQLCSF